MYNCRDQNAIIIWNFKFEVLDSETSDIEFHTSKLQNLKFWNFVLKDKKLHIWSYSVFRDTLIELLCFGVNVRGKNGVPLEMV